MGATPEIIDADKPAQPYREPAPPPCEVCTARAHAAAQMVPFADYPRCPLCNDGRKVLHWSTPHRAQPRRFTIHGAARGPWWHLFWRATTPAVFSTAVCPFVGVAATPLHFHLECSSCGHHWTMRTATEVP